MKEVTAKPENIETYQSADIMKDPYGLASKRLGGILLVDDDPDLLDVFRMILEDEGYTVYTENTVDKAKAIAVEHEIQLAVIDCVLPDIHRDQVAKTLKKIDEKLNIIFLSGYTQVFEEGAGFEYDDCRVFHKPVDPEVLLSTIGSLFDRYMETH